MANDITRILLVRHGETTWNKEGRYQGKMDTPLSEFGRQQGEKVAEALRQIPIDVCYASPLSRALDTAVFCAQKHNLSVQQDKRLLEIDHGEWEGLLASEVEGRYAELLENWRVSPAQVLMPGGESLAIVQERAMQAFQEYGQKHAGQTVLVVAHDAVNKAAVCAMTGMDLNRFWQVKQDNTCINVLEYQNGSWRIVLLNNTNHMGFLFSGIEQKGL